MSTSSVGNGLCRRTFHGVLRGVHDIFFALDPSSLPWLLLNNRVSHNGLNIDKFMTLSMTMYPQYTQANRQYQVILLGSQ